MYNKAGPSNINRYHKLDEILTDLTCQYIKCPHFSNYQEKIKKYHQKHDIGFYIISKFIERLTDQLFNLSSIIITKEMLLEKLQQTIIFCDKLPIFYPKGENRTVIADEFRLLKKKIFASNEGFLKTINQKIIEYYNEDTTGPKLIQFLFDKEPILDLRLLWGDFWINSDSIIESENEFQIFDFEFQNDEWLHENKISEIRAHLIGWIYEKISGKVCSGIRISYCGNTPKDIEFNINFIENLITKRKEKRFNFESCPIKENCVVQNSGFSLSLNFQSETPDPAEFHYDENFSLIQTKENPLIITNNGIFLKCQCQSTNKIPQIGSNVKIGPISVIKLDFIEGIINELSIFPDIEGKMHCYATIKITNDLITNERNFPVNLSKINFNNLNILISESNNTLE